MKQRRTYPIIGLVLLAVALPAAGCGGSSGRDGSTWNDGVFSVWKGQSAV